MTLAAGTIVVGAEPAFAAVPDAPAQPLVVPFNGAIVVSFSPPADGGSPILDYSVACTSSDGGVDQTLSNAPGSPAMVGSLSNGKTYTCAVAARNADGTGAPSPASLPAVPHTTPDAPAAPAVAGLNGQLLVTFDPPFDGGAQITRYTATCLSSDGGQSGTNSVPSLQPITVAPVDNGHAYTCTVFATNPDGDGPASPASAPAVPSTAPDAPGQPTVVGTNAAIVVTFTAPFDEGSPITGYSVTCSSSDGGAPNTVATAASPATVSGLTNTKTYTCTVTASNVNGDSAASPASLPIVPSAAPDAPAAPTVSRGNASIGVSFSAPGDNGSPITGYTATCTPTAGGAARSANGAASPLTVTQLTNGAAYKCTVAATNAIGTSAPSPASASIVPSAPPSRVATPSVSASNTRITVSFGAPASNGLPITSYRASCTSRDGGAARQGGGTHSPITVMAVSNGYTYTCTVFAINADGNGAVSPPSGAVVAYGRGFRMFAGDGGVFVFGDSGYYGSAATMARSLVVGMAVTRDDRGYWLTAQDGSVYAFGDARNYGSMGGTHLNQPIVGITATPSGHGYWLVARDGGIFAYGDAPFYGSTGNIRLNQPIVGMTPTSTGRGYWFVAADGGLFAYGDARFYGSAAGHSFAAIVGMANTASGHGYWIANSAGQVFSFGDAAPYGSRPIVGLRLAIMGISPTPSHRGFWLVAGDGGLFNFGDAPYISWAAPLTLRRIIRGVSP